MAPGRILRVENDDRYNCGLLLLIDDAVLSPTFECINSCSFYTFPLVSLKYDYVRLFSLKMGEFHKLLDDRTCGTITHDCAFNVIRANRAVFEREKDEFGEDLDKDKG